jgi:hypothetical protein
MGGSGDLYIGMPGGEFPDPSGSRSSGGRSAIDDKKAVCSVCNGRVGTELHKRVMKVCYVPHYLDGGVLCKGSGQIVNADVVAGEAMEINY